MVTGTMTDLPKDTIIDLSQPGIIHYVYPTGREVPKEMMDPNIGGYHSKTVDPTPNFKLEHLAPKPETDIWATQIFFEE